MKVPRTLLTTTVAAVLIAVVPATAHAHCDSVDGPVVSDARAALEAGDVTPVLKWVTPASEDEVRAEFTRAVEVRGLSPAARELADRAFFETVVRLHRASEGAPYTGLKPAGTELPPPIRAADAALGSGQVDALVERAQAEVAAALRARYERVQEAAEHADDSVDAGRAWVAAYVDWMHTVEALHHVVDGGQEHGDAGGS